MQWYITIMTKPFAETTTELTSLHLQAHGERMSVLPVIATAWLVAATTDADTSLACFLAAIIQQQAKFWKLRQSELEGYNLLYAPLKMRQGDLTGQQHG